MLEIAGLVAYIVIRHLVSSFICHSDYDYIGDLHEIRALELFKLNISQVNEEIKILFKGASE